MTRTPGMSQASRGREPAGSRHDIQDPEETDAVDVDSQDIDTRNVHVWIACTFTRLSRSRFRSGFELSEKDRRYARLKGRDVIAAHARDLLSRRVAPTDPPHDGRQTPWRGHPVFTAQHATATCCRGCIEKWHGIPRGRTLTEEELDRLCALVMAWIDRDCREHPDPGLAVEADPLF